MNVTGSHAQKRLELLRKVSFIRLFQQNRNDKIRSLSDLRIYYTYVLFIDGIGTLPTVNGLLTNIRK